MVLRCCLDVRHYIFCGAAAPVACFFAHSIFKQDRMLGASFAKHTEKRLHGSSLSLSSKTKMGETIWSANFMAVSRVLTSVCIDILVLHEFFKKFRLSLLSDLASMFVSTWD